MQPTLYTAMLRIEGIYQNGRIELDSAPAVDLPVKVIVTFPEIDAPAPSNTKSLRWSDFSFDRSRQLLKELKSSLAEEVIAERRRS